MKRDATRYDGKVPVCFFSSAFLHLRDEEEYESTRKLCLHVQVTEKLGSDELTGGCWGWWRGWKSRSADISEGDEGNSAAQRCAWTSNVLNECNLRPLCARACFTTELTYTSTFKEIKIKYYTGRNRRKHAAVFLDSSPLKLNHTHLWTCTFSH